MQELDDLELVKQAQMGNIAAVGELYDRYQPRIFRYIRFRVSTLQAAQDLTGELFLQMVNHLPDFRPMGVPFSAWLYRIAHNLVIKQSQREDQQVAVPLVYANNMSRNHDNPAYLVEEQLEKERLAHGLEKIDKNQREVIILRFIVGLSLKETAQMLEKTVAAVKTLQHRGILALQVALTHD